MTINIESLREQVESDGLMLHRCSEHHWQISDEAGPLLNVWPTTGKYLDFDAKPGRKANVGSLEKIVERAVDLALRRNKRAIEEAFEGAGIAHAPSIDPAETGPRPARTLSDRRGSTPPAAQPAVDRLPDSGRLSTERGQGQGGRKPEESPAREPGQRVNGNAVDHPSHYTQGRLEVIDAIEGLALGFHGGNVVKYLARYKFKGGVEDLRKARWYLDRLIQLEQESLKS